MRHFSMKGNILVYIVDKDIIEKPINQDDKFLLSRKEFNKIHFILPINSMNELEVIGLVTTTLQFIDHIVTNLEIKVNKFVLDFNINKNKKTLYTIKKTLNSYNNIEFFRNREYKIRNSNNLRSTSRVSSSLCINEVRFLEFSNNDRNILLVIKNDIVTVIERKKKKATKIKEDMIDE